jgi:glycosyltransferase involved in cell wall biosynthesis
MDKMDSHVSILIPTYKRSHLIGYVLEALGNQTRKDFEVIIVLKPSSDGTEKVIQEHQQNLTLKIVPQVNGYFLDALNLGLDNANGEIVAFLDDDAIPAPDWIQIHADTLNMPNVGGVAGNVIPTTLNKDKLLYSTEESPETIPKLRPQRNLTESIGKTVWNKPLKNMENYLIYLSKAGIVTKNNDVARYAKNKMTKSLLEMGANMCVSSRALGNFRFPKSTILGSGGEQLLGWHLWKQGYKLLYNPAARVYHLTHGQTLSRNISDTRRETLRSTEANLLFYRLYGSEPNLSIKHRISWLIFDSAIELKRVCINKEISRLAKNKSKFYSETIGMKWLLHRKLGLEYSPLADLLKLK